jgi:hypothetical protein
MFSVSYVVLIFLHLFYAGASPKCNCAGWQRLLANGVAQQQEARARHEKKTPHPLIASSPHSPRSSAPLHELPFVLFAGGAA